MFCVRQESGQVTLARNPMDGMTASMLRNFRSVSAPNLGRGTSPHPTASTSTTFGQQYVQESRTPTSLSYSSSYISITRVKEVGTSFQRLPSRMGMTRFVFRIKVFLLLGIQVALGSLQWMGVMYLWRPSLYASERNLYALLLLLSWANLTAAFVGFRRLQYSFPLNWIIFGCIFESLTLLVMCLGLKELDLTWPFLLTGLVVLLAYTALGLWVPTRLTGNLWILILASMLVLLVSAGSLYARLKMRYYVPLIFCLAMFGPCTMYNSQTIFLPQVRTPYQSYQFLEAAGKMYMVFASNVWAVVFLYRFSVDNLDEK